VLTTYCDVDPALPEDETIGRTQVQRVRGRLQVMRYCVSPGMIRRMGDFDILHAHNYRNFQTDCGFFLPR